MKSNYLRSNIGRIVAVLFFLVSVGLVSASTAQAQGQWPYGQDPYRRDRDRDYRRNDRSGRNGGYDAYGAAANQGYQDGLYTGSNDAQRGQNYNPQRSHFYRNGHSDGVSGRYGNAQAYRSGFLRGYQDGYSRYGGRRNNGRNNGRYNRFPFPW